ERFANLRGLSNRRMGSGAGHDAQVFAPRVPTAMIFVPSIGGKSHCPEELSDMKLVCQGAEILTDCLLELANE
ncbi:MAG: M20/M25/M40 family metallo-hydrolase, partial [Pyramidobacter sp.]|nr:M20/M25/M40 family metallo-hydrolase [Pyramidobacter sp.]